ncbi:hypothetical protein D9M71_169660 [compost metagenome]
MLLGDIVAISGLLLTLTTFMFNLGWPRLHEALQVDEQLAGKLARKRCRQKVTGVLLGIATPLLLAFTALFYVNLPMAINIVRTSTIDFWNFDVNQTLYVMVAAALLAFALVNGWLTTQLVIKLTRLR